MKITGRLLAVGLLPCLLGAGFNMTVTPNPGGNKNTIQGSGMWSLGCGETYSKIEYVTTLKSNGQQTSNTIPKAPGNQNWSITLMVVSGTYNPNQGTLYYVKGGMGQSLAVKDSTDYVVN
jgi:hypothetical protein